MSRQVSAVVMAAGISRRMGKPKMTLPWGETTVIGQVVTVLSSARAGEVVLVTGGAREQVEAALSGYPVKTVFNPDYENGEMLLSLQTGLKAVSENAEAALVVLGDQPQIEADVVRAVIGYYKKKKPLLVVPSYRMHRGHPWLVDRKLWPELLSLPITVTLHDFLQAHSVDITYLPVTSASVLMDLDTPADYEAQKPGK